MRPIEKGGIKLESEDEILSAISVVTASMVDFGTGATSSRGHDEIAALSPKLVAMKGAASWELAFNGDEAETLHLACQVAHDNVNFAVGAFNCYGILTDLPTEAIPAAMQASDSPVLRAAGLIAGLGDIVTEFSGLLEIHGGQSPLGQ